MKNLQWLGACVLALMTFVTANAQDSKPEAATSRAKTDDAAPVRLGTPTGDESPSSTSPTKAAASVEELNVRLEKLQKQLDELQTGLRLIQPTLPTNESVAKLIDAKLKERESQPKAPEVDDSLKTIPAKTSGPSNADVMKRLEAIEKSTEELGGDLKKIMKKLGIIQEPVPEGGDLPPVTGRIGFIIIRNFTGETQTYFVNGKEWRIPGDSRTYELEVKLTDPVWGHLWPYDKPTIRKFKNVDGRLESPVDLTLRPVQPPTR